MQNITITTTTGPREIAAVWVGQNLAVNRPLFVGGQAAGPKQWCVTLLATGHTLSGLIRGTRADVVALARLWDGAAAEIDARNPRGWRYLRTWQLDVAATERRRIAPLDGPVLPDNPGPADVAAAMAAALGTGYNPADDSEAAEQYPARETVAADRLRDGADGLEILWRGKWWLVPSLGDVEAWALDSLAETPDGRTVEPDAPDSWPALLGIV